MKVAIINYGMGNVASVEKAIKLLGYFPVITNNANEIQQCNFIVLPGVGAFAQGMKNLKEYGLIDILNEEVIAKKKPFLGICLGMQLIATKGSEPNETNGLNWIDGEVIKINEVDKSIPHLGWNNITIRNNDFLNEFNNKDFYFIHSYHFNATNAIDIAATVNYGHDYVAIIQKENILLHSFTQKKVKRVA